MKGIETIQTNTRDHRVSYIRAVATVMVVVIHIFQRLYHLYPNTPWFEKVSDWSNLGLVMFFVISAFLYSSRNIEKNRMIKWFTRRYLELIIPSLFTVMVALVAFGIRWGVSGKHILYSIFSGLGFEAFVPDGWIFMQYWFLTYILFCYITVPLIQKIDFRRMNTFMFWGLIGVFTILTQGITSAVGTVTKLPLLSCGVLLRFYLPYSVFRRYDINSKECTRVMCVFTIISLVLVVAACFLRYGVKLIGVWGAFHELFFIYTQTISGFVLFYWLYRAFSHLQVHTRLIRFIDSYSYPVYLTHCLFIGYSTSIIDRFDNRLLGIVIALMCTAAASFIVLHATKPIKSLIIGKLIDA